MFTESMAHLTFANGIYALNNVAIEVPWTWAYNLQVPQAKPKKHFGQSKQKNSLNKECVNYVTAVMSVPSKHFQY